MTQLIVPLDDGSSLVLDGVAGDELSDAAHTLGVADFLRDAVLAGVAGNFTYDVLKAVALELRARGILVKQPPASAASIASAITAHLTSVGYRTIEILQVVQLVDRSWSAEGTADQRPFAVRTDPEGQVMQMQVR
ncbi:MULTISPECIES: hypothetical protein [Micromonospora]|uniref:Uncharacterized protein n=1 Tax=Micromonospora haikouensis TaxID=686309 RepID=A0A0D0X402_9ACTN|nr:MULTISPECIES: hypothetical protein [Micromonospora]KIR64235.1 hypothetical protein TK50_00435 [Micromonospora haikouensis]